jgi:hypothetical protein
MGRIDVDLPDELEKQFRQEIFRRSNGKKGGLKAAIIEAIKSWIKAKS